MSKLREAYRRFAKALFKSALREKDFGFVDSPLGQLALDMLDDDGNIVAEFRKRQMEKNGGARLSRSFRGL